MPRTVDVTAGEVVVRLTGVTAVAALRRRLRIPRSAIRAVSTAPWRDDGFRVGGTSIPWGGTSIPWTDYRQGRFRRRGRRQFLSFERRNRVVALEVDRGVVGYDVVVVGVDDPAAISRSLDVGVKSRGE